MSKDKIDSKNPCSLGEIQKELDSLLLMVKPEDKLKKGDTFDLQKDVKVPGGIEIKKGTNIEIVDIEKSKDDTKTTVIDYKIDDGKNETLKMSKGIFIIYFCEDLKKEEKVFHSRLKELKKQEEKLQEEMGKKKNIGCATDDIKEEVGILLKITKKLKKKFSK